MDRGRSLLTKKDILIIVGLTCSIFTLIIFIVLLDYFYCQRRTVKPHSDVTPETHVYTHTQTSDVTINLCTQNDDVLPATRAQLNPCKDGTRRAAVSRDCVDCSRTARTAVSLQYNTTTEALFVIDLPSVSITNTVQRSNTLITDTNTAKGNMCLLPAP